eukprot:scaffold43790_cov38-Cyclotella_meneghiniana.AAC.5
MEYEAPPRVWRFVLEHYPGAAKMLAFMEGEETAKARSRESSILVETVDEESSSARHSVAAPDAVPSQVNVSEPFISSAQGGGSVHSNDVSVVLDSNPFTNRDREPGQASWRATSPSDHVPSWRDRGEVNSFPGAMMGQLLDWSTAIRRSEVSMRAEVYARFMALDKSLDVSFAAGDRQSNMIRMKAAADAREAMAKATQAFEKALEVEQECNARLAALEIHPLPANQQAAFDAHITDAVTSGRTMEWDKLSAIEKERIVSQVVEHLDIEKVTTMVASKLGLGAVKEVLRQDGVPLGKIEQEFKSEHGLINKLQEQMATWDARRNTTSSECGGCVFLGPEDIQALVTMAGKGKLCTLCLDVHGMLTLAQDPYVTYESGVQVHANAIKAAFGSVVESRLKLSFEIPYPELIVKCVETTSTAGLGGAKWGAMFATAELFEDDFRDGSHRRVIKGIENAFDLTQKAIDHTYPLGVGGDCNTDNRKIHTILSDQNRRAYRQCIGFIESLLPFYRTLKGGSLSSEEAWDRVFVFVMEFLTSLREVRVISTDMSDEAAMVWGCF